MVEATRILGGGKKFPNLITGGDFIIVGQGVREYAATEEPNRYTIADAFVVKNLPQQLLVNFYITVNKPPRPTRFFTNENKAVSWLKQFL